MSGVLLKIVGASDGRPRKTDGAYVVSYDPAKRETLTEGGWCHLKLTHEPSEAKVYADIQEALECWRQSAGLRPDGRPNRPLTAFTVTFEPAPGKEA